MGRFLRVRAAHLNIGILMVRSAAVGQRVSNHALARTLFPHPDARVFVIFLWSG
jgi:hypothetical protein